ncbi:MAG: RHS repeat-associated core domain-containing protein [Candidatus Acidiferrum sp.]
MMETHHHDAKSRPFTHYQVTTYTYATISPHWLLDMRCPPSNSTGKERDSESGLDDFDARYYSSSMGRFMSPDWSESPEAVPYGVLSNPQTLNLYAYVKNNPLKDTDPTGHSGDDDIVDHILNFAVSAATTFLSDNVFGAFRPTPKSPEGTFGQAVGDFAAQQSGIAEAEAGSAGLTDAGVMAVIPGGQEAAAGDAVVSGAAVLHGTATAAIATANLAKDANQTSSGGPKANDAPGVTAAGQATDKQGNKLGPSGKPQINETNSNTREGAGNRALNEGSGKVEHPNPKRGEPHFHPTDNKGKKKPGSTHHNYPD